MRLAPCALLLVASFALCGCAASLFSQPPPSTFNTGFWFWYGSDHGPSDSADPIDVLFVQVGTISRPDRPLPPAHRYPGAGDWRVFADLPRILPSAHKYWLVFRATAPGIPDDQAAQALAARFAQLRAEAQTRRLDVAGIQLDIDSPTAALSQYAEFLLSLRKKLPENTRISITALLDWFRNGTSIAAVIQQVDEFVPQFYDTGSPGEPGQAAIGVPIEPARWGPVFNRFRKPFRLGISSFGRARLLRAANAEPQALRTLLVYGGVRPLDVAANPAFQLHASRNRAAETVLDYRATTSARLGYQSFDPGDAVQFILATPESIRTAVAAARQIQGFNSGVVFFRWPAGSEAWAMQPDEVLQAAGARPALPPTKSRIHAVAGDCAAVACADLYLESAAPLSPHTTAYRIQSYPPLEYFLPQPGVPVRLAGPSRIDVELPPYCARGRLYLGRAVGHQPSEFTVQEAP